MIVIKAIIHSEILAAFCRGLFRLTVYALFLAIAIGIIWIINWFVSLLNPLYVGYILAAIIAFFFILWVGLED